MSAAHITTPERVPTLKLELDLDDDRDVLISPQQLQRDLAFWIEGYYNRERRH